MTDASSSTALLRLDGVLQRTDTFRFDVLDAGLHQIGELHPDYGKATIENNINRNIKRTLSGITLHPSELADLDIFRHRVRPSMVLQDGTVWPLGVFMVADRSYTRSNLRGVADSRFMDLGLVDQGLVLEQPLDRSVSYDVGASIWLAIFQLSQEQGLWPVIEPMPAVVGAPVVWPAGQGTRLTVINELLAMAGFYSAYFDNAGVMRCRKAPDLGATAADFDYDTYPRVIAGSMVETNDALKAPNRYVVVSTSAGGAPVVGTWDVPASAPHSVANRGFRVVKMITMQGLEQGAATAAAMAAGQTDTDAYAWADFTSTIDPRHDTFDMVQWQGQLWREQSWGIALAPGGAHRHSLRRVYTPT